jgi:hypothetical protein
MMGLREWRPAVTLAPPRKPLRRRRGVTSTQIGACSSENAHVTKQRTLMACSLFMAETRTEVNSRQILNDRCLKQ